MSSSAPHDRGNPLGGGTAAASVGLFALAALVALLLSALTVAGSWAVRMAAVVEPRLVGDVTVVVWGGGLESVDAATARVIESLSAMPSVRAAALEPDVSDAWVGSLIAGRRLDGDGPRLVSVATPRGESIQGLLGGLKSDGITVAADDHRGGRGRLEQRASLAAVVATGSIVFLGCALFLTAILAGRAVAIRQADRVGLLIRLGAPRHLLASLVRRQVVFPIVWGATAGLVLGAGLLILALQTKAFDAYVAAAPEPVDGVWGLVWLPVVALIAGVGAGLGAAGELKRAEHPD